MRQLFICLSIVSIKVIVIAGDNKTRPEFCKTVNFDAVFYMGRNLTFKSGQWYWQLDLTVQRMMPYVPESQVQPITSLFIDRVPDCLQNKDCDQMIKALDVLFVRIVDAKTDAESTLVSLVGNDNRMTPMAAGDLPWALTNPHVIWPPDFVWKPKEPKPSLYFPGLNFVFYITKANNYSELHYTAIDSNDWYKTTRKNRLMPGITFVGMFHTYGNDISLMIALRPNTVFAIGHEDRDPNRESKLFFLKNDFTFEYEPKNLQRIFFCGEHEVLTPDVAKSGNQSVVSSGPELQSNDDKLGIVFIIIIVIIIFVCIIAISISLLVYVKVKAYPTSKDVHKTGDASKKSSDTKTNETEESTKVSSVETIDSHTGSLVKKQHTKR